MVYNSLFVALIRYVYIVHQKKSNEWDFDRVGKRFQFASVMIPMGMEIVHYVSNSDNKYLAKNAIAMGKEKIEGCSESYEFSNSTYSFQDSADFEHGPFVWNNVSQDVALVTYYIYWAISGLVSMNIIEGFLYLKIFGCIKRFVFFTFANQCGINKPKSLV